MAPGTDLGPGQILMVSGRVMGALILELCGLGCLPSSIYIDMMVFSKLGWNLGRGRSILIIDSAGSPVPTHKLFHLGGGNSCLRRPERLRDPGISLCSKS